VSTDLDPYPASEPGRDLGWYYAIERQLIVARFTLDRETLSALADEGADAAVDVTADDPGGVGRLTARLLSARLRVRAAERYRELPKTAVARARRGVLLRAPRPGETAGVSGAVRPDRRGRVTGRDTHHGDRPSDVEPRLDAAEF
jgi:hypothetical protein